MDKIIRRATAGTLESSDVFVTMEPHEGGLEIEIDSVVKNQYGDAIRAAVEDVMQHMQIASARVSVIDRGALDCVIRARVETAALRGKGE
ncbi:MAG: citrate lyase acyl carrier protein [Clostridia bacterium]|nr:citrate lyase acyl carrier protein [Clostridia bacterium]